MQKKNQKTVDEFLASADAISDDVLEDMTAMLGSRPFIFPVLRERADTFALSMLADYHVFRPEHLPAKMAELSAVAAAAGSGADKCLKVHINAAVKEGATRDEIFDVLMIAATIGKTKVYASALRQLCDLFPEIDPAKQTKAAAPAKKRAPAKKKVSAAKRR